MAKPRNDGVFPARETAGDVRSITPNGTVTAEPGRVPFTRGYYGFPTEGLSDNLGTRPTTLNLNRSGRR